MKETDVAYEQELKRDPYQIRVWFAYFDSKKESSNEMRYLLYERAVKAMPGSYKIWAAYLKVSATQLSKTFSAYILRGKTKVFFRSAPTARSTKELRLMIVGWLKNSK